MFRLPFLVLMTVLLLGGTGLSLKPAPSIGAATPGAGEESGFVGSWRVAVSPEQGPPEVSLGTFHAEGTLTTAIQPVLQAPPDAPSPVLFTSSGHGAWEATGPDTATITFLVVTSDAEGNRLGTATARATLTLDADGQTFHGDVVRTLTDPEGNTLLSSPAMVEGTRIMAEPPEAAVAATPTG